MGDLPAAVRARLEQEADVVLAYLVGSGRVGEARSPRAVDVAVLLERTPRDRSRETELRRALEHVVGSGQTNLVLLNGAAPETAYRALTQGRLLLSRDERLRARHELRAIESYFDMDSLRQMLATGLRHRLGQGGSGPS